MQQERMVMDRMRWLPNSNPRIYDLPFVLYPRTIRRSVSYYLLVCRRCLACPQFYTIDDVVGRKQCSGMRDMLQQGECSLILRGSSNVDFSIW